MAIGYALVSIPGASKEETSPALLRESEDPLRLRARIWSGNLADIGVLFHHDGLQEMFTVLQEMFTDFTVRVAFETVKTTC